MDLKLAVAVFLAQVLTGIVLILVVRRLSVRRLPVCDCPACADGMMVALRSQNVKTCSSCGHSTPWELKEGQLPLIANNRQTRREVRNDSDH